MEKIIKQYTENSNPASSQIEDKLNEMIDFLNELNLRVQSLER